ncbi:hypothetical protein AMEX_G27298, partial [Astyanax mexicanus]
DASSALNDLIKKSTELTSGPPARYRLHTTRSNLEDGKIRKWTFGQKHPNMQNKTILMVGETGTGKTTLINTMVNYYPGVKFEDKVWFEITEEEKKEQKTDQTESKTSEITVYEIFSEEKSFSLTIIDTPGYGDTRGMEKDMEILPNLYKLFLHDTGVKSLDAVCLVLKASQNRISERQRYIFDAILSLFGKDIGENVVLFITYSDGGPPKDVLEAVEKEKIPCSRDAENEPVHFLFNNRQPEKHTAKYQRLFKSSWELGEESLEEFFEILKSQQSKSLTLTLSVLRERMQLEACVQSLKEHIKFTEQKWFELTRIQLALKMNKEKIMMDENYPFFVKKVFKEKVPITKGLWFNRKVTACSECQQNCHLHCIMIANSARSCEVMKKDYCTVCGCYTSKHVREGKKYKTFEKNETVTFADLKRTLHTEKKNVTYDSEKYQHVVTKHQEKLSKKEEMTNMERSLKVLLDENEKQQRKAVKNACQAIVKLCDCALKPDSAFTLQHLEFLIPRLEKAGELESAQRLKSMQKHLSQESTYSVLGYFSRLKVKK